jgi:hypothetical protein
MKFKVTWKSNLDGQRFSGIEHENGWFLLGQNGDMFTYGPLATITPTTKEYTECKPLFLLNNKWVAWEEIEELNSMLNESHRCLLAAKQQWAPNTTNSYADDIIQKIEKFINKNSE